MAFGTVHHHTYLGTGIAGTLWGIKQLHRWRLHVNTLGNLFTLCSSLKLLRDPEDPDFGTAPRSRSKDPNGSHLPGDSYVVFCWVIYCNPNLESRP